MATPPRSRPRPRSRPSVDDSARSEPLTSAPERSCHERQPAHPGAPDPDEVQPPPGPARNSGHLCACGRHGWPELTAWRPRAARRRSRGRRRGGRGRRRRPPSRPGAGGRRAARRPRWRRRSAVSSASRITTRRAAVGHPARVRGLVVGGGGRIRDQDRRSAMRGDLEDRAAGAGDDEVGGEQRVAEVVDVRPQVVVGSGRLERGEVAYARGVQHAERRARERLDRRLVDRARAQRPAEHQDDRVVEGEPEAGAGGARGPSPAPGPAGPSRDTASPPCRRSGTQGRRGARAERAADWRSRDASRPRSGPAGSAAARRPARPAPPRTPRRPSPRPLSAGAAGGPTRRPRARRARTRPRGPQRVATVQPGHADRVQLVAGGRDQLRLRPLATDEDDVGALSPQRAGDRQRRHDVPRRPAGGDRDPRRRRHGTRSAAPGRRAAGATRSRSATPSSSPTAARITNRFVGP